MEHEAFSRSHNRLLLIILIIALLLHAGMMMVFVIKQSASPRAVQSEEACTPDTAHTMPEQSWADRHAAHSNFGAPVRFQDEQETPEQPLEADEPVEPMESTQDSAPEQDVADAPVPLPETEKEPEPAAKETPAPEQIQEQEKTSEELPQTLPQEEILQKTALEEPQEKITPPAPPQTRQRVARPKTQPSTRVAPSSHNNFTLAQLAQGFLDYSKQQGDSALEVKGNHSGPPTDEQLKHERYWQKIGWWIQKTSRMHEERYKDIPYMQAQTAWHLVLNRDGSLAHLMLAQSSGNITLDRALESIIREASRSFPPVPAFFSGPLYQLRFVLNFEPFQQQQRFRINR